MSKSPQRENEEHAGEVQRAATMVLKTKHCDDLPTLHPEEHGWRHAVVHAIHTNPIHRLTSCMLIMDMFLVILGMELSIQGQFFKNLAFTKCIKEFEVGDSRPHWSDSNGWHLCKNELEICDPHETEEYHIYHEMHVWEQVTKYMSVSILIIFMIEHLALFAALRLTFLKHYLYVLDFIVTGISIAAEVWETEAAGVLIFMRVWRFFRVSHGAYTLDHHPAEPKITKKTKKSKKTHDSNEEHVELTAGTPLKSAEDV